MQQHNSHIIASYAIINNDTDCVSGAVKHFNSQFERLRSLNITPKTLTIDPLSTPWFSQQQPNHFRSGCAPLIALEHATQLIAQGEPAVIIAGDEPLSSGYSREQRHLLMSVYQGDESIADYYDQLAELFISQQQMSREAFLSIADSLFNNYRATYQKKINNRSAHFSLPTEKWKNHVTPLFRGIDCANPLIDFCGKILLCNDQVAKQLELSNIVQVAGISLGLLDFEDETKALDIIVKYDHLNLAFKQACAQAQVDFVQQFKQGNALLEAYTCYPIVPMAFLLKNGFVEHIDQLPQLLAQHPITVTGGMNLARAPWNNPSLNALITMHQQLITDQTQYGLVHGNGGLGYRQGVAILKLLQ